MNAPLSTVIRQHLVDPAVCIHCNTCESMCPEGTVTHDARHYVVDVALCDWCSECIEPCPTGAIDHYRRMPRGKAHSLEAQLGWNALPAELSAADVAALAAGIDAI